MNNVVIVQVLKPYN